MHFLSGLGGVQKWLWVFFWCFTPVYVSQVTVNSMSGSGSYTCDLEEVEEERLKDFSDLGEEADDQGDDTVLSSAGDVSDLDEEGEAGWPDRETAKLIELFRTHTLLYDVAHKYYSIREKKEAAYNNIASELGFSVKYLKTRLKSLRTQYTKAKGMMKSGSEGLSVRRCRTLQKQVDLLGFLEPHLRKRTSITNMRIGTRAKRKDPEEFPADLPDLDEDPSHIDSHKDPLSKKDTKQQGKGAIKVTPLGKSVADKKPARRSYQAAFEAIPISESDSDGSSHPLPSTANVSRSKKTSNSAKSKERALVDAMTRVFNKEYEEDENTDLTKLDDVSIFTEHVGRQIRALKDQQKMMVMQHKIQVAIFECQMSFAQTTQYTGCIEIKSDVSDTELKKEKPISKHTLTQPVHATHQPVRDEKLRSTNGRNSKSVLASETSPTLRHPTGKTLRPSNSVNGETTTVALPSKVVTIAQIHKPPPTRPSTTGQSAAHCTTVCSQNNEVSDTGKESTPHPVDNPQASTETGNGRGTKTKKKSTNTGRPSRMSTRSTSY